jgi:hypothetical protein
VGTNILKEHTASIFSQMDSLISILEEHSEQESVELLVLPEVINHRISYFITIQTEHVVIQVVGAKCCLLVKTTVYGLYGHSQCFTPCVLC